jgi:hypothetical protein
MKYICSQTKCKHLTCICRTPHDPTEACDRVNKVCKPCVPVRPKRKPVVVWVVAAIASSGGVYSQAWRTRAIARQDADSVRATAGWTVRGPVKMVLP